MNGGLGNDTMDGGGGTNDVAVFNATAEQMSFAWSSYGGRLTVTSPDGIDVVNNTEWLRILSGDLPQTVDIPITGVVARDDSATASGDQLSLTAAQLLANDTSLKFGTAPTLVTYKGGYVGSTDEGVDVFVDDTGQLFFGPSAYDLLVEGETLLTHFDYEITNGTGHVDTGRVSVTITGTARPIDFEDVNPLKTSAPLLPGYHGYNWYSFLTPNGTTLDTLDLAALVDLPDSDPDSWLVSEFEPTLAYEFDDSWNELLAGTGMLNGRVAPGRAVMTSFFAGFMIDPALIDQNILITSSNWSATPGPGVDTSFEFHGVYATAMWGEMTVDFIGLHWDEVAGWVMTQRDSFAINSDAPTLVDVNWDPIDALLVMAVDPTPGVIDPDAIPPQTPFENFVIFDNLFLTPNTGVLPV
jgi:hypothetical protein